MIIRGFKDSSLPAGRQGVKGSSKKNNNAKDRKWSKRGKLRR
jgi:hypothetical protein